MKKVSFSLKWKKYYAWIAGISEKTAEKYPCAFAVGGILAVLLLYGFFSEFENALWNTSCVAAAGSAGMLLFLPLKTVLLKLALP